MSSDKRMVGRPVAEHGKQRRRTVNGTRTMERTFNNVFGFKEDEVERRKASYTNRGATKVSTRGAPSPKLREVLQDTYFLFNGK